MWKYYKLNVLHFKVSKKVKKNIRCLIGIPLSATDNCLAKAGHFYFKTKPDLLGKELLRLNRKLL